MTRPIRPQHAVFCQIPKIPLYLQEISLAGSLIVYQVRTAVIFLKSENHLVGL